MHRPNVLSSTLDGTRDSKRGIESGRTLESTPAGVERTIERQTSRWVGHLLSLASRADHSAALLICASGAYGYRIDPPAAICVLATIRHGADQSQCGPVTREPFEYAVSVFRSPRRHNGNDVPYTSAASLERLVRQLTTGLLVAGAYHPMARMGRWDLLADTYLSSLWWLVVASLAFPFSRSITPAKRVSSFQLLFKVRPTASRSVVGPRSASCRTGRMIYLLVRCSLRAADLAFDRHDAVLGGTSRAAGDRRGPRETAKRVDPDAIPPSLRARFGQNRGLTTILPRLR